jgi:uncharacterized iron-regulated protein
MSRKKSYRQIVERLKKHGFPLLLLVSLAACSHSSRQLHIKDLSMSFDSGAIISSELKKPVTFDELMGDLRSTRIVFVGEQHTNPDHHAVQLRILEHLFRQAPHLIVGMEMFDRTYQPILDQWSAAALTTQQFIEKVHWYANWKYDFELYSGILNFIKDHHIPLIALNVPSDIPAKIAVGGLENLRPWENEFLPKTIHTSNPRHRSYVQTVFNLHKVRGRENFEYFYAAQCVWEDAMAQSIADHIGNSRMIVFAGNGHIIQKFGVPDRAEALSGASFKTIMPVTAGIESNLPDADYLWVTSP